MDDAFERSEKLALEYARELGLKNISGVRRCLKGASWGDDDGTLRVGVELLRRHNWQGLKLTRTSSMTVSATRRSACAYQRAHSSRSLQGTARYPSSLKCMGKPKGRCVMLGIGLVVIVAARARFSGGLCE